MKLFFKLTIFLVFLFSFTFLKAENPQSYQKNVNGIIFTIDPRFELYNILAMQAGHPGITTSNIQYKKECLDYFSQFSALKTPEILFETVRKGWTIDDPMFFLLYLDNEFNLKKELPKDIINRGGGIEQIQKLVNSIKDYVLQTDFKTFFNETQKDFYSEVLSVASYNFKNFNGVELLEDYYGTKCRSYNLILNILGGYGNFGKQIISDDNVDLYAIVETRTTTGNTPTYSLSISLFDLIIHEFSHGFVNPEIDKYANELLKYNSLYEPIARSMQAQAYDNWHTIANEHIVRSIVTRIAQEYYGKEFAENSFYRLLIAGRYIYADAVIQKLKLYETHRNKYKSFSQFAHELINVFDTISDDYIEEHQKKVEQFRNTDIKNIPKPYEFAKDSSTYFIVSSQEINKEGQKQMLDFVEEFRDMISQEIQIITDVEAINMDLSNNDIVIFGTPKGNSFLNKYINQIPVKISDSYILTNQVIKGSNLQMVTSWVNPFNNDKSMIIYTAQNVNDIKNFYYSANKDQFHFWIAENLVPINVGNYGKYSRVWMPEIF